jgi:flagellar biosynthetic protein FliR
MPLELFTYLQQEIQLYILILVRITALMTTAPFWSSRTIPAQIRVFLSMLLSLILLPIISAEINIDALGVLSYFLLVAGETLIGVVLGIVATLLFHSVQVAGQIVDTQMGFGMVNVIDPQSGAQVPLVGNFYYLIAMILFLFMDGHHYLLQAIMNSFLWVPLGKGAFTQSIWWDLGGLFTQILAFSLRLALPVAGVLFILDLALGIIARSVPQMNVFILGIPGKILAGILVIVGILPMFAQLLHILFEEIFRNLDLLLTAFSQRS